MADVNRTSFFSGTHTPPSKANTELLRLATNLACGLGPSKVLNSEVIRDEQR